MALSSQISRNPGKRRKQNNNVTLSKSLSWLLRHGAEKEGFTFDKGFLNVSEILEHKNFRNYTLDDVMRVVATDNKQRYALRPSPSDSNEFQIRANQGHSIEIPDLELTRITDPNSVPFVNHGTYGSKLESIERDGLSRMNRNHIHFFDCRPHSKRVISGARQDCNVFIYVDLRRAMEDGIPFFRSSNGVILSPGNEQGIIACEYFEKVVRH